MINVRIRYYKTDKLHETESNFVCGKMICKGYYMIKDHSWFIFDLVTNKKVIKGSADSEDESKRLIKKSLKSLGANFLDEVRSTKTNQTPMLTDEVIDEILKQKEGN